MVVVVVVLVVLVVVVDNHYLMLDESVYNPELVLLDLIAN